MWLQTLWWLRETLRSFKQPETISISTVFLLCCSVAVLLFACYSGLTGTLAHVPPQQALYNKDEASRQDIMIGRRPLLCLRFFTRSRLLFWLLPYLSQVRRCHAETMLRALKFPQNNTNNNNKTPPNIFAESLKGGVSDSGGRWSLCDSSSDELTLKSRATHHYTSLIRWNATQIFLDKAGV